MLRRVGYTLFNDEPTLVDRLDRAEQVARLGRAIPKCKPPQVFGVHGEWGCGKTSLLHQLHLFLTGSCPQQPGGDDEQGKTAKTLWGRSWRPRENVQVVWFEAWRYQYEASPVVALLHEIRAQLSWQIRLKNEGRKLAEVAIQGALLSFEELTKQIGIQPSKVQQAGEKWEQEHLADALPSYIIRQQLNHAIQQLLLKQGRRLVVLIDDLDRCESEAAYNLLEAIKIYLNLPNCVFVLGMNEHAVADAIAKHLPENRPSDTTAQAYLEKLCQNIYHLPLLQNPAGMLGDLLSAAGAPDDLCQRIQHALDHHDCLPRNSRKVKRYANALLQFFECLEDKPGFSERNDRYITLMVIIAYLYLFNHDLYRMLEVDAEFYGLIRQFADGEEVEHDLFKSLRLPFAPAASDEEQPVPVPALRSAYEDPVHERVFRIQPLICELGPVLASEIRDCILG